ncbi:MAG: 2-oxoglutarate dehydrogenase E1 component [Bacteroidales bacterium]|nr:2-oxoglutarate dehydrogenase E1 component [Bacteroidales bacterium]
MNRLKFQGNIDLKTIEALYEEYKENPDSVDIGWRKFFEGFEFANTHYKLKPNQVEPILSPTIKSWDEAAENGNYAEEFKVINLINAYRQRGHLFTTTNPVRKRRKYSPTLDIENFGLSEQDLKKQFHSGQITGIGTTTLDQIIKHLKTTYCRSIGIEYRYIRTPEIVDWLEKKMETSQNLPVFTVEEKLAILDILNKAVIFEEFMFNKFPGQKTFSLQGAESLIPALYFITEKSASEDVQDLVIGMAHRGRLNVLANILNKPYQDIFTEFQGLEYESTDLTGDVKYHLGYTNCLNTKTNKNIRATLTANPSHLEAVTPVVEGIARAIAEKHYNKDFNKIIPLIIHGDAAIAGQGVVYETLQMSQLPGYKTGGSIHIIINNQLGFTTNYLDARSSVYCTDIGKILQVPIFHVNGDDVEALVYTIQLALDFRQKYHRDVFIDLLCYRKWGHNESDEPRFTQPLLYKIIRQHPNTRDIYVEQLIKQNIINKDTANNLKKSFVAELEEQLEISKSIDKTKLDSFIPIKFKVDITKHKISPDKERLKNLAATLFTPPQNLKFFDKTLKIQEKRYSTAVIEEKADWAIAELLAYGTLLQDGFSVRLSGQDVKRGTFSHRHSILTVEDSEDEYIPLKNIPGASGSFNIYNSLLSEYGVLGFEYGYALEMPETLTIWEAQFGDFSNGAQIITDQYISSAEEKWKITNDLVLYLPHGYEGQGPDHSNARPERFLSLCVNDNLIIANCTTPANLYHLLRKHKTTNERKPLIIFTPKSLLRHPFCVSSLAELANDSFKEIIYDNSIEQGKINKVILCTGKIYYDILTEMETRSVKNTAIVRIEQLYPFPKSIISGLIKNYNNTSKWIFAQEEPANMGAMPFIKEHLNLKNIEFISRAPAASPATGSKQIHIKQQKELMDKIFETSP